MHWRCLLFCLGFFCLLVLPAAASAQRNDTTWTIRGGSYDGLSVPIDFAAPTRRSSRFWRVSSISGDQRIVGWNPSKLPALVAFKTGSGVTNADSTAFWGFLREMENDMGLRLFEPTVVDGDSDPLDVVIVDIQRRGESEGMTLVTWARSGSLYDARVHLRSHDSFHSSRVVTHEMMHALGFGHTTAWSSVMNGYLGAAWRLTPIDVAYAQLAFESRAASEREDMWERLALAISRDTQRPSSGDSTSCCSFR